MPRKRYLAGGFLIVLVGGLSAWAYVDENRLLIGFLRGEAFLKGAPSSYWRIAVLEDGRKGVLKSGTQMVFDNPDALGVVLDFAKDPDEDVRWPALLLLQHCASPQQEAAVLRNALDDSSPKVQVEAIGSLGKLGATATASVDRLLELARLPDRETALRARKSLWAIDAPAAAIASDWKQFSPEDKSFSVLFAGSPNRSETSAATEFGDVAISNYDVWDGLGKFVVSVANYGPHFPDSVLEQAHSAIAKGSLQEFGEGDLLSSRPIDQGSVAGWEFLTRTNRNGNILFSHSRIFQVGRRRYTALAVYSESLLPASAADYFLNSYTIVDADQSQSPQG